MPTPIRRGAFHGAAAMKRAVGVLARIAAIVTPSCGGGADATNSSVRIAGLRAVDASSCEFRVTGSPVDTPRFDFVVADGYRAGLLVQNGSADDVEFDAADVTIRDGRSILVETMLARDAGEGGRGAVVPSGGTTAIGVDVIPPAIAAGFFRLFTRTLQDGGFPRPRRLQVRVVLRREDRPAIRTEPYDFDVDVCLGCLVVFPDGSDAPELDGEDCCAGATAPSACLPGQDADVDCRACRETFPELCNHGVRACR